MKYIKVNKKNKRKLKRVKIRNRHLVKKYPWIAPRNWWNGKLIDGYDYSYTEWELPIGWHKAFGQMYLKELGAAIKEAGLEREFEIQQIKEKYGSLRVYTNCYTEEIQGIIDKYEYLSENICIKCGKPDVKQITKGWIYPICFDCYTNKSANTEDQKMKLYREATEGSTDTMADSYTIRRFNIDGSSEHTYDISETANAIRKHYERRMKRRG